MIAHNPPLHPYPTPGVPFQGATLGDLYAAHALQGLLSNPAANTGLPVLDQQGAVIKAWDYAEKMLRERHRRLHENGK